MFIKIFTAGPIQTNSIFLGCKETLCACIIDAPQGSAPLLLKILNEQKFTPTAILLTHSHWDHIADLFPLTEALKHTPVYVHPEDAPNVTNPGIDGLQLPFPIPGVKVNNLVVEKDPFLIGNIEIHTIHTPGHSPGSTCFWIKKENLLISGDTLFQGTFGTLNLPTGRPHLMESSLKKLLKLPPQTRVLPGHGEETCLEAESWIKNFKL